MTVREFLENRHKAEYSTFLKVLKALPPSDLIIGPTSGRPPLRRLSGRLRVRPKPVANSSTAGR